MEPVPVKQISLIGHKYALFRLGKEPTLYAFRIDIDKTDKNLGHLSYAGIYREIEGRMKIDDESEPPDEFEEIEDSEIDITPPKRKLGVKVVMDKPEPTPVADTVWKTFPPPKPIDEEDTEFKPTKIDGIRYFVATNKGDTTNTKYVFAAGNEKLFEDRIGRYLGVLEKGKIIKKSPAKWLADMEDLNISDFKPDPEYESETPPPVPTEVKGGPVTLDDLDFELFDYKVNGENAEYLKNKRGWVIDSDLNWIGLYHDKGPSYKSNRIRVYRTPTTVGDGKAYTEIMTKNLAEEAEREKASQGAAKMKATSLIALTPLKDAQINIPEDYHLDQRLKSNKYFWVGDEPRSNDYTYFFKRQYWEVVNGKDTWTILLVNGRYDVLTKDYEWVGKFDPKTMKIDRSAPKPTDLDE